eukprot:CAMPEP_0114658712 /NCGR_PEP_ID=MMETSP0191-20121206/16249_1 /TAXON_ID=126664 /ORGANISM="Sorites sp." /LENGTH=166 /DNA_ID=CAMNT_0001881463 /DNA_START=93 /DNA_END=590 /DNA_ORIENTATION=+
MKGMTQFDGEYGYTTYYENDGPIIFLSQHGARGITANKPDNITNRDDGCWNSNTQECDWLHPYPQSCPPGSYRSVQECRALTLSDSHTLTIADCLYDNTRIGNGITELIPHFITVNIHRSKLDTNRDIDNGAQGSVRAIQAWEEINNLSWGFISQAKNASVNRCGW